MRSTETDQLDFDEVGGGGAVDDGDQRVGLRRAETDRQAVDVRVWPLDVAVRELDQSAEPAERVRYAVCTRRNTHTHTHTHTLIDVP